MNPKITKYKNGQVRFEEWTNRDGKPHRLGGPAFREWYDTGQLKMEEWCIKGEMHRLDGPADCAWFANGQSRWYGWYINGVKYETEAEFKVAVDLYKANEIAELF